MSFVRRQTARGLSVAVAAMLAASCGQHPVMGEILDLSSPSQIVVTSEGGIAALRTIVRLDSASRVLTSVTCGLGVPIADCGTRGYTDQATLSPQRVDSAFAITQAPDFRALRADYGSSTQGADLMGHSVSVTANHRTRLIKGDDMTLPLPVHKLRSALATSLQSGSK
jgi:hypothetical protein